MKPNKSALPFLLTTFCLSAVAGTFDFLKINDPRGNGVRDAVEAHHAVTHAEAQRGEAASGRRLTPAQLAELRQQVRQQWSPQQDIARSAESQPAERIVPAPNIKGATLDSPGRTRR